MRTQLRSNFGDHARRVLWTAALLATALVVPATSAVAQLGRLPGNMEEALQPEFTRRDMVIFDSDLRLDDDQKTILASLFADYEKAVSAGIDAIHKELTGLMPAGPVEDAATRQRREVLRQQITELNAEMEKDQAQDPQSRKAMREKADAIRQEMRALQAASPDVDAMRQMFAKAATQVAVWQAEKARLRDIFVGDVQTILQEGQKPLWAPLERRLVRDRTISRGRLSGESVDLIAIV